MCAGALRWAQIGRIVYGASDKKYGFGRYIETITHPKTQVSGGVMAEECSLILSNFFKKKRMK
jgi:tRNA(adenine34) deaminase